MDASQRISAFCEEKELPPDKTMLISLSLEEMLISIKDHCFPEDEETINVRILIGPGDVASASIVLRIRCSGAPFNPIDYYEKHRAEAVAQQDLNKIDEVGEMERLLEDLDDSLGIGMILACAPSVDYKTTFGVNNLTIII